MASSSSAVGNDQKVDDAQFLHGRIDPGVDTSIGLVKAVNVKESEKTPAQRCSCPWNVNKDCSTRLQIAPVAATQNGDPAINTTGRDHLTNLPAELIDRIFTFLEPLDLNALSITSKQLSARACEDLAWKRCIEDNLPGVKLTSPYPCATYRALYAAHDPYWFLPKYKIWFCDFFLTGKVIIARYDPRRGCIEGYRLVAERSPPSFDTWDVDEEVLIHSFSPHVKLHMDQPVLHFDVSYQASSQTLGSSLKEGKFRPEVSMPNVDLNNHGAYSNFILTRPVEERPNMQLWPPPTIPARHRVRNASQEGFHGEGHKPQKRADISDSSFRIRRWMEMGRGTNTPGVHLGEELETYATLDPKLYTPTEDKPWRGIWVGDYSGHGCEFLLMNQPDNIEPFDEASVMRRDDETPEEFEIRKKDERKYRGSIEAIKLTGDPNIPRGEYTFVADDISQNGYIRTAEEARFKGARIVRSKGHIAARMFRNDKYIESQLIMISHNRLAQYWVGFGHISFYERVDIDKFLCPEVDTVISPALTP